MKREAVVVIHGIGEQKPMTTLRGFVDTVSDYTSEKKFLRVYNVPDTFSTGYELRQLAVYYGNDLRTDFYEYYWAHNLRGTKWRNIWSWLVQLMFRNPSDIPSRIRWLYYLIWCVTIVYIVFVSFQGVSWLSEVSALKLPLLILVGNILLNIITFILIYFLGDAARYTDPAPDNIDERNKIRKAGIDLVDKIHKSGKYSRVVIVGHSLGSIIGYDILKHLWAQYCKTYDVGGDHSEDVLAEFNKGSSASFDRLLKGGNFAKEYMKLQARLLKENQLRGNPWLITDFITLGSPLAHAKLLMANSSEEFHARTVERELPVNPPVPERDGEISYEQPMSHEGKVRKLNIIHHAGLFAFTRWHNLYYPLDFVGGTVAPAFGPGVHDVKLKSTSWKNKVPFLMHTNYWGTVGKSKVTVAESTHYLKQVILRNL